jgi:hypothetical protein
MQAQEIALQLIEEVKPLYQYHHGQWLLRYGNQWRCTNAPRLIIWQAMGSRKHLGVEPSPTLADEIQRCLEIIFEHQRRRSISFLAIS